MTKTTSTPKAKAKIRTYDVDYVRNTLGELLEHVGSCATLRKEVAIAERAYRKWKKELKEEQKAYRKGSRLQSISR